MQFAGWDASSATCQFRFTGNAGAVTFELTSVLSINDSQFDVPTLWPDAGVTMADVTAQLTENQLAQANAEGEVIAVGVGTIAVPTTRTIAEVSNGANNKNRRELSCGSSHKPTLDHYDSAGPTNVASQGTAIDWTQLWTIRGRWASNKMLDNAANPIRRHRDDGKRFLRGVRARRDLDVRHDAQHPDSAGDWRERRALGISPIADGARARREAGVEVSRTACAQFDPDRGRRRAWSSWWSCARPVRTCSLQSRSCGCSRRSAPRAKRSAACRRT
jgi:hypothetical protein